MRTVLLAGGALLAALTATARAGVVSTMPDTSFANSPVTISLGTGTYTFTAIPNTAIGNPPDEVRTTGSAKVSSLFGGVTDFFANAMIGGPNQLYTFSAFASNSIIPNSAAHDYIGLAFTGAGGLHYGYAQVFGTELVSYGYETGVGVPILTGATAAPEPSAITVLLPALAGLLLAGGARRRVLR